MPLRLLSSTLLILLMNAMSAQCQQTMHLTGNPKIDFFGSSGLTSRTEFPAGDSIPTMMIQHAGQEKSPWLAGLLSFAVPGAGEVYSGSYLKGAFFFAVEATSWIIAYAYDKEGNRRTKEFEQYANRHWNAVRYIEWTRQNLNMLNPTITRTSEDYAEAIYHDFDPDDPPTPATCRPPFHSCIRWSEMNMMESEIGGGHINGYTHQLPSHGEQQYYELIGKYKQYYSGWDDAVGDNAINVRPSDFSPAENSRFIQYSRMRARANDYYDVASTFVSVAVINHIVSAIDAFWSASRYNRSLHADLHMRVQPTGLGAVPLTELRLRYDF